MEDVDIRQAETDDAVAVQAVIRAAYAAWKDRLPDLTDISGGVEDDISKGRVWAALEGESVVGCLIGGASADAWHVANVAVAPQHGGKGIGGALMRFAVEQALQADVKEMVLATHREMSGNVALYEHLGWQISDADGNRVMMRRDISL